MEKTNRRYCLISIADKAMANEWLTKSEFILMREIARQLNECSGSDIFIVKVAPRHRPFD